MHIKMANTNLKIADKEFQSRLICGSSLYPNPQIMRDSLRESETEIVTIAIRRIDINNEEENVFNYLKEDNYFFLPNTAGCYTAKDAILTAKLAREAIGTNWIKLEVIGDDETLFPDSTELIKAAEELLSEGFVVLPYCNDDPILCRKLKDIGCHAIMPLGAPIGSGMGICNPYNLRIIRERIDIPIIVDAGVGTASDAAIAMELGMDGVLMNSAIAKAK
ncbi:MAG: thiazole synthase, partial [Flavobacteriales bacterium]